MFIRLNSIAIFAFHGVYDEEIRNGNQFEIDLEIETADSAGAKTDAIGDALDYTKLYEAVIEISESKRYNLLEAFANDICLKILDRFSDAITVQVKVRKIDPPIGGKIKFVEVEYKKQRNK